MKRRTRIAPGIYTDRYGVAATVKVGRIQRERRFPPDHPLDSIQAWQARTRADLLEDRQETQLVDQPVPVRGTFQADVPKFLKQITARVSYAADRSHLKAWLPFIGPLPRTSIRPSHIRTAIRAWLDTDKSPRTIRHRVRVLRELYRTLDGAHARPPLQGITLPSISSPAPTPAPHTMIQAVAASLKKGITGTKRCGPNRTSATMHYAEPAKAYARFLVRATTGQRPSQIARAEPTDVDLTRRIWFVRPGKGGLMIPIPLDAQMVKAWKAFIKANAWGTFDARSFSKTIRRHGWPTNVRPYNLRHTFAIDHLLAGTSLGDVQGLLGHKQIETTRKHYAPVLLARLKKTIGNRKLKLA